MRPAPAVVRRTEAQLPALAQPLDEAREFGGPGPAVRRVPRGGEHRKGGREQRGRRRAGWGFRGGAGTVGSGPVGRGVGGESHGRSRSVRGRRRSWPCGGCAQTCGGARGAAARTWCRATPAVCTGSRRHAGGPGVVRVGAKGWAGAGGSRLGARGSVRGASASGAGSPARWGTWHPVRRWRGPVARTGLGGAGPRGPGGRSGRRARACAGPSGRACASSSRCRERGEHRGDVVAGSVGRDGEDAVLPQPRGPERRRGQRHEGLSADAALRGRRERNGPRPCAATARPRLVARPPAVMCPASQYRPGAPRRRSFG